MLRCIRGRYNASDCPPPSYFPFVSHACLFCFQRQKKKSHFAHAPLFALCKKEAPHDRHRRATNLDTCISGGTRSRNERENEERARGARAAREKSAHVLISAHAERIGAREREGAPKCLPEDGKVRARAELIKERADLRLRAAPTV